MAGGAGSAHRPRRHDHQGAGRQARGAQRRRAPSSPRAASPTCCCAWPPARRSAPRWSRRRRSSPRASSGWPTTCSCAARSSSTTARPPSCATSGKSLLPIGVVEVAGRLPSRRRDRRAQRWPATEIGRGLANYGSAEARLIARKPSSEIERAARLRRRARADPPRQPRAGVSRQALADRVVAEPASRRGAGVLAGQRRRRCAASCGAVRAAIDRHVVAVMRPHARAQIAVVVVRRAAGSAPARSAPSGRRRA